MKAIKKGITMNFNSYRELLSYYANCDDYFENIDDMLHDAGKLGHRFDVMDDVVAYGDYHEYMIAELDWTVMGVCTDETWNGWERPVFTFEQAQNATSLINDDFEILGTEFRYDEVRDCFVEECDGEVVDEAFGFDYNGLHVYRIGNGYLWEDCEEWL